MAMLFLLADAVLLLAVLGLGFLLLGALRALGRVRRRQDELETALGTRPGDRALAPGRPHAGLRDFVPRPDDIFIVTYPRSGTTWMQMILYQLTTDGDMTFAHIEQVCP
jgi:hypothetical protein